MDVDEKGKRRVSWDSKRGSKNFKWVARACTELCKCKLGLGHNKLVAQQKISNSSLGPSTTSLNTYEIRECSKDSVGPILSTYSLEKFGESPLVSLMSSMVPALVAGCFVMPQKAWVEVENARKSFSMPLLSIVSPIWVV